MQHRETPDSRGDQRILRIQKWDRSNPQNWLKSKRHIQPSSCQTHIPDQNTVVLKDTASSIIQYNNNRRLKVFLNEKRRDLLCPNCKKRNILNETTNYHTLWECEEAKSIWLSWSLNLKKCISWLASHPTESQLLEYSMQIDCTGSILQPN